MHKKIILILSLAVAIALLWFLIDNYFYNTAKKVNAPTENVVQKESYYSNGKEDLIRITLPKENSVITSPVAFRGEARGIWFFEASFPVILVDWDGRIIAQGHAQANSDWMTEDFVPFDGNLNFEKPYDNTQDVQDFFKKGALIFQKDNPSGLSEHDDALEMPIRFDE